tara:strand:+ start:742 stop:1203 length:462 start_codon:yes stop_codon:yes gene_type:complete
MKNTWPVTRTLLMEILADRVSDAFVCELVWERLGYKKNNEDDRLWTATSTTPSYWSEKFPSSPQFIAHRPASIHLTRSIPKELKQSLKQYLGFEGYQIKDLFPRRTRRATVVNWLVASAIKNGNTIPEEGLLPDLVEPPTNPLQGHSGDIPIE